MKYLLILLLAIGLFACNTDDHQYVMIETEYGDMKVMLYDDTPQHRDNFVKLASEGFYDSLLFHRVIPGFMIQGGDPQSKNASPGKRLGMGGPGYQIPAEIGKPHIKGTIAAARNNNPEKKSSGSQFYLVHGTPQTDQQLDQIEKLRNIEYNETQRTLYKEMGGTPQLDMEYTVFGEVVDGLEVIDKIAAVPTGPADRPVEDVRMTVRVVN